LTAWFASDPYSDFNMDGVLQTQDIFDFIADAFAHSSGGSMRSRRAPPTGKVTLDTSMIQA